MTDEPSATPFWFGPEDRRLFGWLHHPGAAPVGGVVLCYPLGYEVHTTYRTFRVLAERLSARGIAALRFDYDGTGNSVGDHRDPGRVEAWQASVRTAVAELGRLGVERIGLVGMRMGALLADTSLAVGGAPPVDALVLWDPSLTGKRFLREITMLEAARAGHRAPEPTDGSVEAAGAVFTAETTGALRTLELATTGGPPRAHTLAVTRDAHPLPDAVTARLSSGGTLEVVDAVGQDALIDVPIPMAAVPDATVDAVVDWLGRTLAGAPATPPSAAPVAGASSAPDCLPATAIVGRAADGRPVVERFRRLGPLGLFAVETVIDGHDGPVVVGTNSAKVHHIGQNRMWVDLARLWAPDGVHFVRIDVSGIGDSPARPGQVEDDAYAIEGVDDIRDVADALVPGNTRAVSLLGLCSGAYLAVDAASAVGLRSIGAINPNLNYRPEALLAGIADERRVTPPTRSYLHRIAQADIGAKVRDHLPSIAWYALDRLRIHVSPARGLEKVVDAGVEVLLVYGADDLGYAELQERASILTGKLKRRAGFRLEIVDGLDHAMLLREPRDRVVAVLTTHIDHLIATHPGPA